METLRQKQSRFCQMVADLIQYAKANGYEVTFGEAYRPPEVCEIYAKQGRGIRNSLHARRLAIDLNLFEGGRYLSSTESHKLLGLYWESKGGSWGGRFGDGNHYSLAHNGVK